MARGAEGPGMEVVLVQVVWLSTRSKTALALKTSLVETFEWENLEWMRV